MSSARSAGRCLADVPWRPPTIVTDRLVIRGWQSEDAEAVFRYASNPAVTAHMAWDPAHSVDDAHTFLNGVVAPHYEEEQLDYTLALRATPAVAIGGLGAFWSSRADRVMVLGYVLDQPYWGLAYMPEAARALMRHAFVSTDVCRIFAPIYADNAKSRRAAEKMGLSFEGVLRSSVLVRGVRRDEAIYAVIKGENDLSDARRTILER